MGINFGKNITTGKHIFNYQEVNNKFSNNLSRFVILVINDATGLSHSFLAKFSITIELMEQKQ